MSNIQIFDFKSKRIRFLADELNNPWIFFSDVCSVLEISRPRDAFSAVADKYKRRVKLDAQSRDEGLINESGFYKIVLRSDKPIAERFQDWVVEEVLPAVRKNGFYSVDQNLEWKASRIEGKTVRRMTTDVVQIFIGYAKDMGSGSPEMYFQNFSKVVNKALLAITKPTKNVRDQLNVIQLQQVAVAETIIARTLMECMRRKLHYKEIFQIAKKNIETYALMVGKSSLGQSEKQTLLEFTMSEATI